MRAGYLTPLLLVALCVSCSDENESQTPIDPAGPKGRVVVRITGVRNDRGRMMVRLYRGGKGFPSSADAAAFRETYDVSAGTTTIAIEDVPYGEYALWICHDEDGDGELKSNFLGMPQEGVGVSGPPPSFIPTYGSARFTLDSALSEHDVELKYM